MNEVFFTDMHAKYGNSIENKLKKLLRKANLKSFIGKKELVALKVHVGERGNTGFLSHNFARVIVEEVKNAGGNPYITDTNTLYSGGRHNGVDHVVTAVQHGYSYASVGAPFIPADGIRGLDYIPVKIEGKHFKEAKLAAGIVKADKIIFLTHFKAHIEAGIGGTIKNLSMGCASIAGKQEQHSTSKPEIKEKNCTGCRQCYWACPEGAITMVDKKAVINYELCIGCGQCVAACNYEAMQAKWDSENRVYLEKVCEYAVAAARYLKDKALYLNFAINITPDCDCWPASDVPIVEDVGIFGSYSPLSLERATLEMVSKSRANERSSFKDKIMNGPNVFQEIREHIPSDRLLEYSRELGLEDEYRLIFVK